MIVTKRVRGSCLFCHKQVTNPTGALENLRVKAQVLLRPHLVCYDALVETFEYFDILLIEVDLQISQEQACVRCQKATSSRTGIKSRKAIHSLVKTRIENLGFLSMENYQENSVSKHTTTLINFEFRLCLRDVKS